jgi:uncharacterized membrane protein YdjX (TVP38/TMEM64 family)
MGVDTECDLVVQADGEERATAAIRSFRSRLMAEHLGADPGQVEQSVERTGSLRGAIEQLGSPRRTLAPLEVQMPSGLAFSAASLADMEKPVSLETLAEQLAPPLEEKPLPARLTWVKLLLAAAVVIGLTATWRFTPLAHIFTAENVIEWTQSFSGYWWAPLIVIAAYTPASLVMFPRPLITLAAVVSFGAWTGFACAMTGVLLASAAGYYAGRAFGRDTVRRLAGPHLNRLSDILRRRGVLAITAVRQGPLAPFIVESMVAGAIHMRLWQLSVGTFLGMLPGALMATVLGDAIEEALYDPSRINWWFVTIVVVVLATATYFVQRWLRHVAIDPDPHESEGDARPERTSRARTLRTDSRV